MIFLTVENLFNTLHNSTTMCFHFRPHHSYPQMLGFMIRVRVRERLSATPGHVIGQGSAPGGGVVPCGGGGSGGGSGGAVP